MTAVVDPEHINASTSVDSMADKATAVAPYTFLDYRTANYYLATSEIDILETKIQEIVAEIPDDSDVIELGCGSLRKTKILLDALNRQRTGITYYAIDVMPLPLHESMESLSPQLSNITFVALCGTYEEVMSHFKKSTRRKTIIWLGSSIGNCTADEATAMLSGIVDDVLNKKDAIMIGMDLQKDCDYNGR
ncbi:hypothetical protein GGI22_004228, partial [Coemansia erecta]